MSSPAAKKLNPIRSLLIAIVLLGAALTYLVGESFESSKVLFAKDGAIGVMVSDASKAPETAKG